MGRISERKIKKRDRNGGNHREAKWRRKKWRKKG